METTVLHEVHQHNNSKRTTDRLSIHTSPRATSWQVDDVDWRKLLSGMKWSTGDRTAHAQ